MSGEIHTEDVFCIPAVLKDCGFNSVHIKTMKMKLSGIPQQYLYVISTAVQLRTQDVVLYITMTNTNYDSEGTLGLVFLSIPVHSKHLVSLLL